MTIHPIRLKRGDKSYARMRSFLYLNSRYLCRMHIDILTVLPELLESPLQHSMMKRAQEKGILTVKVHQLRKWAVNEYGQVDDYQYGGGAGMVMMCEPLAKAIEELTKERKYDEVSF